MTRNAAAHLRFEALGKHGPLRSWLAEHKVDEKALGQMIVDFVVRWTGIPMAALDDFMLDEDDQVIVDALRGAEAKHHLKAGSLTMAAAATGELSICNRKQVARDTETATKPAKWIAEQAAYCDKHGLSHESVKPPEDVLKAWALVCISPLKSRSNVACSQTIT